MLEQKMLVGRYINLTLNTPPPPHFNDGDFMLVPVQDCYLQESTGGRFTSVRVSAVIAGGGPKAHRKFKWLPWVPGAISETNLVGTDVLTGPMSGCWLVTYRKANGVPHAGHLGTVDLAQPNAAARNAAVNGAWNAFATAHAGQVIGGFNPLRHWNGAYPPSQPGEGAIKIFGLYTTDNHFYAIGAYPQGSTTMLRIAGIQLINSVPVARLQHVDQPGP